MIKHIFILLLALLLHGLSCAQTASASNDNDVLLAHDSKPVVEISSRRVLYTLSVTGRLGEEYHYKIYSASGIFYMQGKFTSQAKINARYLSDGPYYIKVTGQDGNVVKLHFEKE